jgi:hypothetical protein
MALPCPPNEGGSLGNLLRKGKPPTEVSVAAGADSRSATVRWSDPNGGVAAYVVFARCATPDGAPVSAVRRIAPGEPAVAEIDNLRPDANYCFSVGVVEPQGGTTLFTDPADRTQFRCLDGTRR